jgi:hypothetical protein
MVIDIHLHAYLHMYVINMFKTRAPTDPDPNGSNCNKL